MNEERDLKIVQSHCAQLAEYFETVMIFVSKPTEDGTINCHWGSGNWFARYGQIKYWIKKEEASLTKEEL